MPEKQMQMQKKKTVFRMKNNNRKMEPPMFGK